ncbi:MAG: SDR family NAD(P)-dependent oxidoreductase, partial [Bradymonadaceae bacterium]
MVFEEGIFKGKTVLITGGGTGIGRELARQFGRLGAHVVVAARREEPLAQTVSMIEADGGLASFKLLDIRDADGIAACIDEICSEHGRIDVLVNNAG